MRIINFFLGAAIALGLHGCGGGDGTPPELVQAFGKAHLETPVSGATVELQDANGKPLLGAASTLTGTSGAFSLPIDARHTPGFRVAISGGTYQGKPFNDTLLLEVEHFDTRQHLLYVNALTTLVSRHKQRSPGKPLATVSREVLNYLEVPASTRAAIAVDNPYQNYFGHQTLLDAAQVSGIPALGGYLDTLQAELAAGQVTRAFVRASAQAPAVDRTMVVASAGSVVKTVEQIANGLLHSVGEEAFSWVFESILTSMGLGGTAEILDQLHEINAKLDEIKVEVDKLNVSIKETDILIQVTNLTNHIAVIQSNFDHLTLRAHAMMDLPSCERDSAGEILNASCAKQWEDLQNQALVDIGYITDANVGVGAAVKGIQMVLTPTAYIDQGLLNRWFLLFKEEKPFFAPVVDERLKKIQTYYQAAQLMGSRLLVEAAMSQSSSDEENAKSYAKSYAKFHAESLVSELAKQDAQVATFKLDNDDVMIDQGTKLVWMRAPKSNLEIPVPGDIHSKWYSSQAKNFCQSKATQRFAGYDSWRQPTDAEFHALVNKPGSPTKGDAQSGAGAFNWLISQGFLAAADPTRREVLGLVQNGAYFSSTISGWSGNFHEVLRDDGVDYACSTVHSFLCENGGNQTSHAGAWCVAGEATVHE